MRSALIATVAVAVAGVWIFVTPGRFDEAMDDQAAQDLIHDVILRPDAIPSSRVRSIGSAACRRSTGSTFVRSFPRR